MEEHLMGLGYTSVESLKGQDPEAACTADIWTGARFSQDRIVDSLLQAYPSAFEFGRVRPWLRTRRSCLIKERLAKPLLLIH